MDPDPQDGPAPTSADEIAAFLDTLLAIEQASAQLDALEKDVAYTAHDVEKAARLGGASAAVLTRAAALLSSTDGHKAHALLQQAVTLGSAPAPAQLALARSYRARGDKIAASHWLRGAILRARPDASLLLELATIEIDHARAIVAAAQVFGCRQPRAAQDAAEMLMAAGKLKEARVASDIAFKAGARAEAFLVRYSELLADPDMHEDPPLPPGPLGMPHWWNVATHAAQTRLAGTYPAASLIARARIREASDRWIGSDRMAAYLSARIASREPFSWIRLGDGETRFLMHLNPELRAAVPAREAEAMARQIWFAWFGEDIEAVPSHALALIGERLDQAIRNADLLGVTGVGRLADDGLHYGFCAALEHHLEPMLDAQPDKKITDALLPIALNEGDPFLGSVLRGLDFLGVVSPHADLAARLQRHLGIEAVASYMLPGEHRLGRAEQAERSEAHFPAVYERTLATLAVPRPGAVFLVAGGLLGKIYCDRIRALGGIALDIGALADAWMGHNTRGALLEAALRQPLPG